MFEHIQTTAKTVVTSNLVMQPQYVVATTGSTVYLESSNVIIAPATALAALTIDMPPAKNGFTVTVTSTKTVDALTVTGGTVAGAPATLTANIPVQFVYSSGATSWIAMKSSTTDLLAAPQYKIPTAGATVTITSSNVVLNPAADLATLTIALPTANNGDIVSVTSTKAVTALTITGTVEGGPSALTANVPVKFIYITAATSWFIY